MIIREGNYRQTQENNHGVFLRRRNDNRTQFRDIFRKGGWMQSSYGNGLNDGSQSQNQSNQPSDIDSQEDMPLLFGFEEGLDYLTETNSDRNSPKYEQIAEEEEEGNLSNSLNGDFTQDLQMNHKSKKILQIHLNKSLLERKKEFSLKIKTKEIQLDNDINQAELQSQKDTIRQISNEKGQIQVETYGKGFTILSKMGYKLGQGLGKFQQGRKEPIEVNFAKTTLDMQEDYEAIKIQNKLLLWDQFKIIVEEDEEEQQGGKSLAGQKDIKHEEKICNNEGTISKQRHKQIVEPMEFNVVCHGVSQDLKSIQKQMKIQLEKITFLLERSKMRQTHLKEELVDLKRNTQPISDREDYCRLFIDQLNEVKNTEDCQEILKIFEGMFITSNIQFVKFGLEELLLEVIGVCLKRQNSIFLSENDATSTTTTTKDQIIELVNLVKGVQKIIVLAGNIKAKQLNQQLNQNKQKVFQSLDEIISRGQIYISEEVKLRTQQLSNCIKCQLKIFIKECLENIQIYNLEMIICIEECKSIMSKQQIQEILSDGVFSRLFIFMKDKINTWNPTVNSLRQDDPDYWLLPWIELFEESQYLPELLDQCVEIIINKFKSALSKWQLTDETMIHRITPWKTIIGQKTWDRWITRQIIPKLTYFLEQSFEIDPWEQQQLETITHILQWCQVISSEDVQILLSDTLFAKIAEFLVEWVNTEGANLSDILDWIQEWEDIIGPHLMQIPSFHATFNSFRQKCQR